MKKFQQLTVSGVNGSLGQIVKCMELHGLDIVKKSGTGYIKSKLTMVDWNVLANI